MKKHNKFILAALLIAAAFLFAGCTATSDSLSFSDDDYWLNVPSLKEKFQGKFEYVGLCIPKADLLGSTEKQAGLKYHASSTTMENEMKPDAIFAMGWTDTKIPNVNSAKFTSSLNGTEITVPDTLNGFGSVDQCLAKAKELGLKMRGHVLVWYSQTPKAFFCKDYDANKDFVNADEMTARQEWYIKTVLKHVKEWETANMPAGEHLIYAWDVVNEALSDSATAGAYLRVPGNSNWASIYGKENYEYIINAFRFANKYAPADVKLAYNDYNEFQGAKHQGYLKILDEIIAHKDDSVLPTRIDIAGMQSHNQYEWPSMTNYESAIKNFIAKGLDIHITELDITGSATDNTYQTFNPAPSSKLKSVYADYFKLYLKYAKTAGKTNGITSVTLWGINDQKSWRKEATPLLFSEVNGKLYAKPAFYGVISAAGK